MSENELINLIEKLVVDEESNLNKLAGQKLSGQETPHDEDDMAPDGMDDDSDTTESIEESKLISRLKRNLNEEDTIPEVKPKVKIPDGLFTKKAADIVSGLLGLAGGLSKALTRISFYINRGGDNLPNKTEVLKAKKIIEKKKK